ncbi:molybdopterin synthase catalytic subunit MoaE [Aliiglaciecola sp. 3_MG-2023]|uniref:molybdopterin synthase catalytic subunit MoaE n=1 Tax=Aliiglaciecola sp. 3_MG-2023 TaxID=3062644 RepID=UPI0026E117E4|nr:molybdopterin synthase catalytic subunit MoaE [Aliiglaciecola sp. 3_MG-2023]MDO6693694.1 molybdopterin synthase catalytic subunit MoaE [Aliiglaciecola sp. 3_MG-2023]
MVESAPLINIIVQQADFDHAQEYQRLKDHGSQYGAIVTFTGLVRDMNLGESVSGLFLEHYPGMTEKVLNDLAKQAAQKWSLGAMTIIHRVGQLAINQQIVFVGVSSKHRSEAFEACQFLMDFLKTNAPFWKKELRQGSEHWIQKKQSDELAAQKWDT